MVFFVVLSKLVLGRNRDPKACAKRSRRPSAAGRRNGPEAVTEQKTGLETRNAGQNKAMRQRLAADFERGGSPD
jgi:hypothetical protein